MTLADFHPSLSHFPIALLISALVFEIVGQFNKRESFLHVALYVQALGVLGAAASVVSGEQAEEAVEHLAGIEAVLEQHERLGTASLWFGVALVALKLFLWKKNFLTAKWKPLLLVLSVVLAGLAGAAGKIGGQLVYTHGAGVGPFMQQHPAPSAHEDKD